jgi:hypothetical protein
MCLAVNYGSSVAKYPSFLSADQSPGWTLQIRCNADGSWFPSMGQHGADADRYLTPLTEAKSVEMDAEQTARALVDVVLDWLPEVGSSWWLIAGVFLVVALVALFRARREDIPDTVRALAELLPFSIFRKRRRAKRDKGTKDTRNRRETK